MQEPWLQKFSGENGLLANRYRLGRPLGRGSFGQVFYAEDTKFQPPRGVAIKVLHPQFLSDATVREEVRAEAGVLARFNHPYILRVIDFELNENLAYIVTELAEGGSLARLIRPDPAKPPVPMPLPQIARYLENIATALDEAHHQGLVHRDIKPQNILLDKAGRPMLADFGLASALGSSASSVMVSTTSSGTPLYMAPEQWTGQVGKTTDIYALGVVVYQLITGYPPYQGNQEALAWQHFNAPVPRLSERAPELKYPPALDDLMREVLAKDPRQRLRPAGEFARRFREIVGEGAITGTGNRTTQPDNNPPPWGTFSTQPIPASSSVPPLQQSQAASAYTVPSPPSPNSGYTQTPTVALNPPTGNPPPVIPDAPYVPPPQPPRRPSRLPWLITGLALLLLIGGGVAFLLSQSGDKTSSTNQTPVQVNGSILATSTASSTTTGSSAVTTSLGSATTVANCPTTAQPPSPPKMEAGKGQLQLDVLETDCKPAKGSDIFVKVYQQGDRNTVIAQDGGANRLYLTLPPGTYEVEVSYANGIKQVGTPIEVKAGQLGQQSVVLRVGQAQLEVLETANKSAKGTNIFVRVYRQGDPNTVITQDGGNNKFNFVLRPGTYELEVTYANSIKQTTPPIEVKEGQIVSQTVNLGVGQAQLEILDTAGKSARDTDIFVRVYKQGDPNTVITQDGGNHNLTFTLRPGTYEFEVTYANGIKQTGKPLEVKEGQSTSQSITLGVGNLALEITLANGTAPVGSDIFVRIYKQGDRNAIITQDGGNSKLNFVLRPGTYELEVTYSNGVKVSSPTFEIKEGQTTNQTVKL